MKGVLSKITHTVRLLGVRHLQTLLLFLVITVTYFNRISASVAVVAMTNRNTTNPSFDEFSWTLREQSLILSSFYWGYVFTQLPAGWFSQRYGSKFILLFSTLVTSILGIMVPFAARKSGWEAFCAIRVFQGLAQGFVFPVMHTLIAKWAPFKERNLLGAFSHSGIEVGTILAFTASGYIAASSFGWPGIYYISGGLGLIWTGLWGLFGASSPYDCKYISEEEKNLIESSLQTKEETHKKTLLVPWREIWFSGPFLTLLGTRVAQAWGFSTLMNEIPKYMIGILGMNIQENALFSGLPYMVMLFVCYFSIAIADFLIKKNVSLLIVRKAFNSIAFWIPALFLIGLGFVTRENAILAVILLVITVGLNGMHTIGSLLNHIDLSPNFAGILMGITNTAGNIVALITPLVFSAIVNDKSNLAEWRTVFCIAAGMFLVGNLIFLLFGETAAQPFNEVKPKLKEDDKTELPEK